MFVFYVIKQFIDFGLALFKFCSYNFWKGLYLQVVIDFLCNVCLIYIIGGDQNCFMDVVANSLVYDVIYEVYYFGVIIVGISVGVVVMSEKMIIGNEWCYLEYIGNF